MAQVTKLEVLIDLNQPVQEISSVISLMIALHPGRQKEILNEVDLAVGAALARLDAEQNLQSSD